MLGNGSYGVVMRAFDQKNNLNLAVKKIFIGNCSKENMQEFQNEAILL